MPILKVLELDPKGFGVVSQRSWSLEYNDHFLPNFCFARGKSEGFRVILKVLEEKGTNRPFKNDICKLMKHMFNECVPVTV